MAKKWPGIVVQRSFIKRHSFPIGLYVHTKGSTVNNRRLIIRLKLTSFARAYIRSWIRIGLTQSMSDQGPELKKRT